MDERPGRKNALIPVKCVEEEEEQGQESQWKQMGHKIAASFYSPPNDDVGSSQHQVEGLISGGNRCGSSEASWSQEV